MRTQQNISQSNIHRTFNYIQHAGNEAQERKEPPGGLCECQNANNPGYHLVLLKLYAADGAAAERP
jgi:hypothetical protein